MKKIISLLACILIIVSASAQSKTEVISQSSNSITVKRTYTAVETYKKVSSTANEDRTGRIGINIHSDYNFNGSLEFGAAFFYWFGGQAKGKFGINAGYDYGMNRWWQDSYTNPDNKWYQSYWDIRGGIVIYKYVGLGVTYGKYLRDDFLYNPDDFPKEDWGAYANINLPITKCFGLFIDGKWTQYQGWSVGGGVMFMIPTKL